jgi:pantoate--beta-alanine ligase
VRESDGLALSSRNRRLAPADRAAAVCIPRGLEAAASAVAAGERDVTAIESAAHTVLDRPARIATAVWFDDIRLIDNFPLLPPEVFRSPEG